MKNRPAKFTLSSLLAFITLFSSFHLAFGAAATASSDIKGHWAENEMNAWMDKGFIHGYQDGTLKPDSNIIRTEFMALINRSFGFTETASISYTDLTPSNWAYTEVAKAKKAGYIQGYTDGTIGVNKYVSRQEAAVIIHRLLDLDLSGNTTSSFKDSSSIASWAQVSVDYIAAQGIMTGYTASNSFKPTQFITRAEAIVALERALNVRMDTDNDSATPAVTSAATPIPTPIPTATPPAIPAVQTSEATPLPTSTANPVVTPTPTSTPTSGGIADTTAPVLSRVSVGPITVGDNVYGESSEEGYLYLVPRATLQTIASLDDAVKATMGQRSAVTASVYSFFSSQGLSAGTYVVYAVDGSNNISAASTPIVVDGLQLTIAAPALLLDTKMYNGTKEAAVTASSLVGVMQGDQVEVHATATYSSASPGTNKAVTVVYTLSGAHAASYIAPVNYSVNNGSITVAQLTIELPDLTLAKFKDGTTTAAVTAGSLIGVVSGEDVTVQAAANYDSADIGTHKTITVVYTLSGADAGNYKAPVNYTVTTGEIDKDRITRTKVYDGTAVAAVTLGQVSGIIDGDDVTVNIAASYTDAKVGTNKTIMIEYTLSGADAGNYFPPTPYTVLTGTITALQLAVSPPLLTESRIFNGSTAAAVTAGQLSGVVAGDDVTVTAAASYSDADIGTNKTITVVYTLSGADAANYITPANDIVTTGRITAP
ncbi:YDG domain-containing protein [Paenibacillus donghaensis]|uniref:SLH domain-containing protein n=1 Tax=Paenibacillus donghaensis TaxID=414771 RepID=A0A2Z2KKR9_9BACL|nr:YDG domain-containing protein [Paenibacillus donghaensis]ASA23913.1 hypothetical protein B9T62_25900 [Paenibacillus donghaensis]